MTKENTKNTDNEDEIYKIEIEDSVEILTTDDERLKTIGEELSNDMGRAILTKLFDGQTSISDIATQLNTSMQLVSWHIQRLAKIGLIRISKIEHTSKNKKMYRYTPTKFALLIIPTHISKNNMDLVMNSVLNKTRQKFLSIISFVVGGVLLSLTQTSSPHVELVDADRIQVFPIDIQSLLLIFSVSSFGIGIILAAKLFHSKRLLNKLQNKKRD